LFLIFQAPFHGRQLLPVQVTTILRLIPAVVAVMAGKFI